LARTRSGGSLPGDGPAPATTSEEHPVSSTKTTFAARAGHWSAHHRKTAIGLWLVFVIGAVVAGQLAGLQQAEEASGIGESARAEQALERGFPQETVAESVIVQAPAGGRVTDARVRAAIADVVARVAAQPRVQDVRSPLNRGNQGQLSPDGRSALVEFELRGTDAQAEDAVVPVLAAVKEVAADHPGVFIGQFGGASANKALSEALDEDFQKAERLSLPITLLILLLAFGSIVAAGVPLLLGVTAVMAALGLVNLLSHAVPMDESISAIILLVGLLPAPRA
jgi:RND superfamily putative drug exporter